MGRHYDRCAENDKLEERKKRFTQGVVDEILRHEKRIAQLEDAGPLGPPTLKGVEPGAPTATQAFYDHCTEKNKALQEIVDAMREVVHFGNKKDNWRHRAANMRCRTCMFFVLKEPSADRAERLRKASGIGRCRRHAPTMAGFPAVFETDWCGDHKLDENKIVETAKGVGPENCWCGKRLIAKRGGRLLRPEEWFGWLECPEHGKDYEHNPA